jgi:tetratricopeptide (TPR) repeat protein
VAISDARVRRGESTIEPRDPAKEMPGAEGVPAVPENPDKEAECPNISVVALAANPGARKAALSEAEWRADELAAELDRTKCELATTYARLEHAEETIAAVNEIAEAAQATIDKLRAEIADAEARTSQLAQQRDTIAAELSRMVDRRETRTAKLRDHLGWKLISRFPSLSGLRISRLSLGRARPSLITLADRARDAGQWELAARHYREALDRNPRNSPIWVQYGHALKETGQVAEAERAYRKAIELDSNAADPHLQLGHALKMQRKRNEAAAAYLRALDLDPALDAASLELVALGWTRRALSSRQPAPL